MRLGYAIRASQTMLRHPRQGVERIRGRIDRRRDKRELGALGIPASDLYGAVADWERRLHASLDLPWPCQAAASFGQVWDNLVAELTDSGVHVGMASYGGWNDSDRAFAEAIWCIIAHLRPATVVETGVAHGVTSRIILQSLERNGSGHLWSVDLPAVDPALHREIGIAVPEDLQHRWTYVQGTSRERLPHLLTELGELHLFVHDSLHTGRNLRFELESAWAAMPPGGTAVVDDIDHSLGFRSFVDLASPRAWFAARHVTGGGLWGVATKARTYPSRRHPQPMSEHNASGDQAVQAGARRAANIRALKADPRYRTLRPSGSRYSLRERRHGRIEQAVVCEIADAIKALVRRESRLLHIHARHGLPTLLFRDQLARPERPVIYDREDGRAPEASLETDFAQVDVEAAEFPAPDGHFDIAVWNRDLVTVMNVVPALREARRVLRPGGILVVAVPNLAALHNRLLLLAGRQPTTLHINGDHVRGFTIPSMTRFLERDLGFGILRVRGVGLAPITGAVLPRPLRGLSHTVVWVLRKAGGVTREAATLSAKQPDSPPSPSDGS